jgi:hypothetical protein
MRVALIGNSYFAKAIVEALPKYRKDLQIRFYDTSHSLLDRAAYVLALPFTDVVYALSGSLTGGGALTFALRFNKPIFQHFIGSDVLAAIHDFEYGRVNSRLVRSSKFAGDSTELAEKLKSIGIPAVYASCFTSEIPQRALPLPKEFSVLTYIRQGKEDFYGLPLVLNCARMFPNVSFRIAGLDQVSELPPNVQLLGWVNDLARELENCSVFLRLVQHDGQSHSVIQGLAAARWVLASVAMPGVILTPDQDTVNASLRELYSQYLSGKLEPNVDGHRWACEEFTERRVVEHLIAILDETVASRP